MDPLSLVALSAALGGGAGKFVEKAWDSGDRWIQSFYKDHSPKAIAQATRNSLDFLTELADRVKLLEEEQILTKEQIGHAQDHPDFSVFLQKALLTSAQSDSEEKHKILARLVSERLTSEPESAFGLASKMACDTLSYTSVNQMKLLGLALNLLSVVPNSVPPEITNEIAYQEYIDRWITNRLKPFQEFSFSNFDLQHIEALSLVTTHVGITVGVNDGTHRLNSRLSKPGFIFEFNNIHDEGLKNAVHQFLGPVRLDRIYMKTTGQIIGAMISDLLTGTKTSFDDWK
jgi:hypothetical protein